LGHKNVDITPNGWVKLDSVDAFGKKSKISKSYNRKEIEDLCNKNCDNSEIKEIGDYLWRCILTNSKI
jgi:hypothetical protein